MLPGKSLSTSAKNLDMLDLFVVKVSHICGSSDSDRHHLIVCAEHIGNSRKSHLLGTHFCHEQFMQNSMDHDHSFSEALTLCRKLLSDMY